MKRIVFLDYLRVFAIFLVLLVHVCEQYYFGPDGGFLINSKWDAGWLIGIDSLSRASVPLFVMTSSFLLFPVKHGPFLKRRLLRVGIPFLIWCCVYNYHFDGKWTSMLFNFPMATGGHLWFVPMLIGLYLLMPLLSPWAEQADEKTVRRFLWLWAFTTTFPYLRRLCGWLCGAPSFGATPFLWGECPWNGFGTFHYVSGFVGYMMLGFYFRKFVGEWTWSRTLRLAIPLWLVGYAIVALGFYCRLPIYGSEYPISAPYAAAVDLEMSWEFCSTGVLMTVIGYFLVIRKLVYDGWFYQHLILPLSQASYGVYLVHILVLVVVMESFKPCLTTPLALTLGAIVTFVISSAISIFVRKIPFVGKYICG